MFLTQVSAQNRGANPSASLRAGSGPPAILCSPGPSAALGISATGSRFAHAPLGASSSTAAASTIILLSASAPFLFGSMHPTPPAPSLALLIMRFTRSIGEYV